MSVLITSAGRRSSLVAAFQRAAHARELNVLAGDADPLAPALHLADEGIPLPTVDDSAYVSRLLELVAMHRLRLIVPTIDPELPVLAAARKRFDDLGCAVAISDPDLIEVTADKWLTSTEFGAAGIAVPESWLPGEHPADRDDLFIKPRFGSASADTYRVRSDEVAFFAGRIERPIVQELLEGPEITVDALMSAEGEPLHFVPRLRVKTVGGESIQGRTIAADDVAPLIRRVLDVCAQLGGRGPMTIQAFLTDDGPVLTEVNPRFGGGAPLAFAAGAEYPEWMLSEALGEPLPNPLPRYVVGLQMTRFYREIFEDPT